MNTIGSSVAQSLAGLHQAEKAEARDKPRPPTAQERRAKPGEHDSVVVHTETADAVRSLKDNTQEDAQEDRHRQPAYGADGSLAPDAGGGKSLDVRG